MANGSEKYQADRENNQEESSESGKKTAKVAAKAAADYFTGGKGGAVVDKLADTKLGQQVLNQAGKVIDKNPLTNKAAQKLNNSGALDAADKGLSMVESGGAASGTGNVSNQGEGIKSLSSGSKSSSSDNKGGGVSGPDFKNLFGQKKNKFANDSLIDENEDVDDYSASSQLFATGSSIGKQIWGKLSLKTKLIIIAIVSFLFLILCFATILFIELDDSSNDICTYTSNADESSKRKARFTTYIGTSLGGSIGNVSNYVKEGTIYYEDGYAMWKGGTKSKLNGKVYGESGTDYMIVATATEYLFGNSSGFGYTWSQVPNVAYFNYGDTFTIEVSFDSGATYKSYNAIVLDSCGACMEWSLSAPETWRYSPHSTNQNELNRCEVSEGYKIDLYTSSSGAKAHADMGYFLNGNSSNTCIGEVDLGDLVTGTSDTQLLDKPLIELFGEDGMNELNELIASNVEKYGAGTGKGAAAAAITLINSIKTKGYRLPYYWTGGHGAISIGANPNWGSRTGGSCNSSRCYYFNSLDCSGFVSWAVRNGGCTNFSSNSAANFMSFGPSESIENAKAGDVLASSGHVLIVVQNNAGKVILAESSGGTGGVHFSEYSPSSHSNYKLVDMSGFYSSTSCK